MVKVLRTLTSQHLHNRRETIDTKTQDVEDLRIVEHKMGQYSEKLGNLMNEPKSCRSLEYY